MMMSPWNHAWNCALRVVLSIDAAILLAYKVNAFSTTNAKPCDLLRLE